VLELAEASGTARADASAELDLELVDGPDPVSGGEALSYTVAFGNRAAAATAPGAQLALALPDGATFVSASDGGVHAAGVVTWTLGSLQAGRSGTRRVITTAPAGAEDGAVLEASAYLRDASAPPQEAWSGAVTRVRAASPVALEAVAVPDPVRPGEALGIELVVANRGNATLFDAFAELVVPDGVDSFDEPFAIGDQPLCIAGFNNGVCDAAERLTWTLGDLEPGTTRTLRVPPLAGAALPDGTLLGWKASLEAIAGGAAEFSEGGAAAQVDATGPFDLELAESADPVPAGGSLTYAVAFGHRAAASLAPGTQLTLALPPGAVFVSASNGGLHANGLVTWPLGTLTPGESGVRRATVTMPPAAGDGTLLEARAAIADASTPRKEASAEAVTRIRVDAPISVDVLLPEPPVEQGGTLATRLRVRNETGSPLFDLALEAVVPDGVQSFSATQTDGGTCIAVINNGLCDSRERIAWAIAQLASGATVEFDVPFTIRSDAGAPVDGDVFALRAVGRADGDEANALAVKTIPEPTSALLGASALAALSSLVRRRRGPG
jgi:hypothetical protein